MPTGRLITVEERGWVLHVQREHGLSDDEVLLLVHAVRHGRLTDASARAAVGSDSVTARGMLRRLRDLGLLDQHGRRGGASYEIGLLEPRRTDAEVVQDLARRAPVTIVVRGKSSGSTSPERPLVPAAGPRARQR